MRLYDQRVAVNSTIAKGRLDINTNPSTTGAGVQPRFIFDNIEQRDPVLKMYRPSGTSGNAEFGDSYPLWMQYETNAPYGLGYAQFHIKGRQWAVGTLGDETESEMIPRLTILTGNGNVGINQILPDARFQVSNGSVLFDGTIGGTPGQWLGSGGSAVLSELGAGTRMMWIPNKAAFRAGILENNISHEYKWNDKRLIETSPGSWVNFDNIGLFSFASGQNTYAPLQGAIAMGDNAKAGELNTATDHGCIAIGHNVTSLGIDAIAMGYVNTSSGNYSGTFGESCQATSNTAFAIGQSCISSGVSAFAAGNSNYASGNNSVALSSGSIASGINAIAIGSSVFATANNSISIGTECESTTRASITLGEHLFADGANEVLIGRGLNSTDLLKIPSGGAGRTDNVNSLGIGFLSDVPTFYVGPAGGYSGSLGRVGIGLSDPANRLDVNGAVSIGGSVVAPTGGLVVQGQSVLGGTTASTGYILTINGSAIALGAGAIWQNSDRNLKKNITTFSDGLAIIKQINPVRFHYNGKLGVDSSEEHIGVLAQDIQQVAPYTVRNTTFTTKTMVKSAHIIEKGHLDSTVHITLDSCGGKVTESKSYTYNYVSEREFIPEVIEEEKSDYLSYNPSALAYLTVNAIKELDVNLIANKKQLQTIDSITQMLQLDNKNLQSENLILSQRVKVVEEENILSKQRIKELEDKVQQIQSTCCKNTDLYDDVLLEQNTPNPFSKETIITYFVPERLMGRIELIIADASGNTIINSVPIQKNIPSQYTYSTDLQIGVYLYGISLNGQILKSKKMIIIK